MLTYGDVLNQIVSAYEVLIDTSDRIGPAGIQGAWPEYRTEIPSIKEEIERIKTGAYVQNRNRVRIQRTASEISQMNEILLGRKLANGTWVDPWLYILREYEYLHAAVALHAQWTVSGTQIAKGCRRIRLSPRTFRERRKKGAQMIADVINRRSS